MSTQYTRNLDWSVLLQGNYFEVYFLRIYLILQLYKQQIFFVANYVLALLFIFFFFTIALSIYPSFHFVVLLLPDIFFFFFFSCFLVSFYGAFAKAQLLTCLHLCNSVLCSVCYFVFNTYCNIWVRSEWSDVHHVYLQSFTQKLHLRCIFFWGEGRYSNSIIMGLCKW